MKKPSDVQALEACFKAMYFAEIEPERFGGVVYRTFGDTVAHSQKFFVAPSGKLRKGMTAETSQLVSANEAKSYIGTGLKILNWNPEAQHAAVPDLQC